MNIGNAADKLFCQEGWHRPALSLFAKVSLVFSCKLPKSAHLQSFLLTHCDFCGNLSQQFNITYLLRVPARLPKEPEQVFNFLSLHNEPEPRPSRKGWSGSGCCVAIFYCKISNEPWKPHDRLHGIPGDDPEKESWKTPPEGGAGKPCRENGRTLISQLRRKTMWSNWPHRFSVTPTKGWNAYE